VDDVVLGFADLAGCVENNNPGPCFGALVGRYGNRIAGAPSSWAARPTSCR